LVSAGVGFAPVGLQYPVLTASDSVLRLIAVEGVRLEGHIYPMLPSVGETSPAARRFADQLLRIHPAVGAPTRRKRKGVRRDEPH
jgi:hypothetical protein